MPKRHITQRSLDTILPLRVKDDGDGLDYFIPKRQAGNQEDLPMSYLGRLPGARIGATIIPKDSGRSARTLCSLIEYPIIPLGGKDETAAGQQVAAFIDDVRDIQCLR